MSSLLDFSSVISTIENKLQLNFDLYLRRLIKILVGQTEKYSYHTNGHDQNLSNLFGSWLDTKLGTIILLDAGKKEVGRIQNCFTPQVNSILFLTKKEPHDESCDCWRCEYSGDGFDYYDYSYQALDWPIFKDQSTIEVTVKELNRVKKNL